MRWPSSTLARIVFVIALGEAFGLIRAAVQGVRCQVLARSELLAAVRRTKSAAAKELVPSLQEQMVRVLTSQPSASLQGAGNVQLAHTSWQRVSDLVSTSESGYTKRALLHWLPCQPTDVLRRVARHTTVRCTSVSSGDDALPASDDAAPQGLPEGSLVLEEEDIGVWQEERLEYAGLLADSSTPPSLRGYLCSFRLPSGVGCHAFDGRGRPLPALLLKGNLSDTDRLSLVLDVLSAVNHLHCRGSAHLDLQGDTLVARRDAGDKARAILIGLGAAVRLQAARGRSAFQLSSAAAFRAPETLGGVVIESNLRALFLMDAWSAGVLVAMISGGLAASPFEATAVWSKGEFAPEAAVSRVTKERFANFAPFLQALDSGGDGFLFRHGWLVKVLLGLLSVDPKRRMTVHAAWRIARDATRQDAAVQARGGASAVATEAANRQGPPGTRTHTATDQPQVANGEMRAAATSRPPRQQEPASSELNRFRNLQPVGRDSEPFRSLEAMLNIAQRGRASVVIERRQWAGIRNYGEVVGFRNRADADRWDVFVPGLKEDLPIGVPLPLKGVLGVVLVKGGNHKLAVELAPPYSPFSRERISADVRAFIRVYSREHPNTSTSRIKYLELTGDEELALAPPTDVDVEASLRAGKRAGGRRD